MTGFNVIQMIWVALQLELFIPPAGRKNTILPVMAVCIINCYAELCWAAFRECGGQSRLADALEEALKRIRKCVVDVGGYNRCLCMMGPVQGVLRCFANTCLDLWGEEKSSGINRLLRFALATSPLVSIWRWQFSYITAEVRCRQIQQGGRKDTAGRDGRPSAVSQNNMKSWNVFTSYSV